MSRINLNFTRQFNVVGVCVFSAEFIMATFERPGTSGCRVPPPLPGQRVPKEYVRQQLHDLGIKSISEEELESYTAGECVILINAHLSRIVLPSRFRSSKVN